MLGERRTLVLGLLMGALGFAAYGAAPSGRWFLCAIPVMALWGLAGPAAQALITREAGSRVQGRIQGAMSSLTSLAGIAGPTLYTTAFAAFIGAGARPHLPGMPWFIASALLAIALLVAWKHHVPAGAPPDPPPAAPHDPPHDPRHDQAG